MTKVCIFQFGAFPIDDESARYVLDNVGMSSISVQDVVWEEVADKKVRRPTEQTVTKHLRGAGNVRLVKSGASVFVFGSSKRVATPVFVDSIVVSSNAPMARSAPPSDLLRAVFSRAKLVGDLKRRLNESDR